MTDTLAGATGTLTIDLGQIAANWRALAARVAPAECAAVVKADAYGLGVHRVVPTLEAAGCQVFFVATPDEAFTVRELAPAARIYVLNGPLGAGQDLGAAGIRPVLSSLHDIELMTRASDALGRPLAAALHIDTGLNRLGLRPSDVRRLAAEPEHLRAVAVALVMSHLASADVPRDAKNPDQLLAFETLSALFPDVRRSLAASDGLMLGPAYHFDLVRPGYALYGGQASQGRPTPVKPVVSVRARILSVFDVAVGETVGYATSWRASKPCRIATLAAGYADGVPRSASAASGEIGGHVVIGNRTAPIVGRVSMDLITVDVSELDPATVQPGVFATLVGEGISLEEAGFGAATIGYELLTRLGQRFKRLYIDAS